MLPGTTVADSFVVQGQNVPLSLIMRLTKYSLVLEVPDQRRYLQLYREGPLDVPSVAFRKMLIIWLLQKVGTKTALGRAFFVEKGAFRLSLAPTV